MKSKFVYFIMGLFIVFSMVSCGGGGGGGGDVAGADGDLDAGFANNGVFVFDSQVRDFSTTAEPSRTLQEKQVVRDQERQKIMEEIQQTGFNPVLEQKLQNFRAQFDDNGLAVAFDNNNNKIVVAGTSEGAGNINMVIVRLLGNGNIDPAFNNGNAVIFDNGLDQDVVAVRVNADQSITVVGGTDTNTNGIFFLTVSDFNADGTNNNVQTDVNIASDFVVAADFDGDNKLIAVLDADGDNDGNRDDIVVARFLAGTVTLDNTFSTDGLQQIANSVPKDVVVNDNDEVIVVGSQGTSALIAKIEDDGDFDVNFDGANNGNGVVTFVQGNVASFEAVDVDNNDNPIVTGFVTNGATQVLVAKFLDANGNLDATFDGDGFNTFEAAENSNNSVGQDVFVDGNDILIVGFTNDGGNRAFVTLVDNLGVVDAGFGDDGFFVSEDLGGAGSVDNFVALVLDNGDNVIAVGTTVVGAGDDELIVAKVLN